MELAVKLDVYEKGKKDSEYTINSDISGKVSLKDFFAYTKLALLTISREVLREEQAKGFDKEPVVVVDGRANRSPETVNPVGKISFIARAEALDVLEEIYAGIIERSPVDTGQYVNRNQVYLNKNRIANNREQLAAWVKSAPTLKSTDVISFINTSDYARKLERLGVTAQRRGMRTQKSTDKRGRSGFNGRILAANGTYFLTSRSVKRKYKSNVQINFLFVPGSVIGLSNVFQTQGGQGRKKLDGKDLAKSRTYLYPAITVRLKSGGTL